MASGKKSFILYSDLINTVDQLPDEKAGDLFKTILRYVNDLNPDPQDLLIRIAFEPIKQQLKRDLKKWDKYIKKQQVNGKMGGRPKTQINPEKGLGYLANPDKPKKADNVTVSVNVTDTVIKRERAFAPPSKEEVINEMSHKLDDFTAMGEADKFMNHYQANGWKTGKNKMKDWKAAARGWLSRMSEFKKVNGFHQSEPSQTYQLKTLK